MPERAPRPAGSSPDPGIRYNYLRFDATGGRELGSDTMAMDLPVVARSTKYPLDAFIFVQRGLDFTVRRIHGEPQASDEVGSRHVSGQELCLGLRDYAIQQYGMMARTVLRRWNILSSEDFGHIVFAMVDAGLMHKTDEDTIRDFVGVYDFAEAFASSLQLSGN